MISNVPASLTLVRMIVGTVASMGLLSTQLGMAAPTQGETVRVTESTRSRFSLGAGLSQGYLTTSAEDLGFENNLHGFSILGELLAQLSHERLAVDLGLGWTFQRSSRTDGSKEATLQTKAGVLRINPRFKIGPRWELGPSAALMFGGPNLFGRRGSSEQDRLPVFGGLVAAYQWADSVLFSRVKVELSTDITVQKRQLFLASVGFDFALPVTERVIPRSQVVEKRIVKEVFQVLLDTQVVHFDFRSAKLNSRSESFLKELGTWLAQNQSNWGNIDLAGHTDEVGKESFNQSLSLQRAEAVRSVLVASGIPEAKISVEGFGQSRPIRSYRDRSDLNREQIRNQNRRVELNLNEVHETAFVRDELRKIRLSYLQPTL